MTNTPELHTVHSVAATAEPGVYSLVVDATDVNGDRHDGVSFLSRPDDTFGLSPLVRVWLSENLPYVAVTPYQPPTAEQVREGMPRLTARQLRLGLVSNGIIPIQVQASIEAMPPGDDREKALVEWEYAYEFERTHPLIATVGASLALTEEQIDAMWSAASVL